MRETEIGKDRRRRKREMSTKDQGQTKVSTEREGHSRSIAERRCRLSAFVRVREAEFALIVQIQRDLEFS